MSFEHPETRTFGGSLSVPRAIKVLEKGGEVASVYVGRTFFGRFEATTDRQQQAITAYAERKGGTVLDWVTGEAVDW